jgi:hypothetical protein
MTWNEIQIKWADMTRRVRSDLPCDAVDTLVPVAQPNALQQSASNKQLTLQSERSDA